MTNPRYVYMPVWQAFRSCGLYMLDGSIEENFVIDLDNNNVIDGEVEKVFFTQEEAMDSWQDAPKNKYGVIQIDLDTGEWEMVS